MGSTKSCLDNKSTRVFVCFLAHALNKSSVLPNARTSQATQSKSDGRLLDRRRKSDCTAQSRMKADGCSSRISVSAASSIILLVFPCNTPAAAGATSKAFPCLRRMNATQEVFMDTARQKTSSKTSNSADKCRSSDLVSLLNFKEKCSCRTLIDQLDESREESLLNSLTLSQSLCRSKYP